MLHTAHPYQAALSVAMIVVLCAVLVSGATYSECLALLVASLLQGWYRERRGPPLGVVDQALLGFIAAIGVFACSVAMFHPMVFVALR